jgi:hypothetical protein
LYAAKTKAKKRLEEVWKRSCGRRTVEEQLRKRVCVNTQTKIKANEG